ncbi:hypothetical protein D3C78_1639560 [compost metagenome]
MVIASGAGLARTSWIATLAPLKPPPMMVMRRAATEVGAFMVSLAPFLLGTSWGDRGAVARQSSREV